MAAKGNNVKFIQFNGYLDEWNGKLHTPEWDNAVVFGYILDNMTGKAYKKIYAGKDTVGLEYIFDFENGGKWTYGSTDEGWHEATDLITNPIGQITGNMTLADLVSATNNGDFSRILEMMLFRQAGPQIIVLDASVTPGSEKNSIRVHVKTTGAAAGELTIKDSSGYIAKQGALTPTELQETTVTIGNLLAGMRYEVILTAKDGTETVSRVTYVATQNAVLPDVSIHDVSTLMDTVLNKYKIDDVSNSFTENDYDASGGYIYKITGEDLSKDNLTLAQLKNETLTYRKNYNLVAKHAFDEKYHYQGQTPAQIVQESSAYTVNNALTSNSSVSVISVNGVAVQGSNVIDLSVSTAHIVYSLTNRLNYSTKVQTFVNTECKSTETGTFTDNTYDVNITLTESSNVRDITVKVGDEYDEIAGISNVAKVKFERSGNVSILKVNNMDVPASVSTFILDTSVITLNCSVNSRFDTYSKLSVYVDDILNSSVTGNFTRGIKDISIMLESSADDRDIMVKVSDAQGEDYMESNEVHVNYEVPDIFYMSVLCNNTSHTYDNIPVTGSLIIGMQTALPDTFKTVCDLTLNPTYDLQGLLAPGTLKNFINDAKSFPFVNVKSLATGMKGTKMYYKYQFTESYTDAAMYILVPAGYDVIIAAASLDPNTPGLDYQMSNSGTQTLTVNGIDYYVYQADMTWTSYDNMKIVWINVEPSN